MQEKYEQLLKYYNDSTGLHEYIKKAAKRFDKYGIYPDSVQQKDDTVYFIAKGEYEKALIIIGQGSSLFDGETIQINRLAIKTCKLSHTNCEQIRKLFPYTNPVSHAGRYFTFGLGDRLGLATPGHIRSANALDVFPVLAQQSIREINLTGRDYTGVLDDVGWAVFQEGYTKGFGADGDHIKTREEVEMALGCGFTMITLDCSDHIDNTYFDMSEQQLEQSYARLPESKRSTLEVTYLSPEYMLDAKTPLKFTRLEFLKAVLVYEKALDFIGYIYHEVLSKNKTKADFEVSVDETTIPTSPQAHFYIASELKKRNVIADSMAPRFCGEFQKGIDYIGNLEDFEKEFIIHAKIAAFFGYKLSIHSGSDKFSVFPVIGRYTQLHVHVKTAGTNWLEAVRVIAQENPTLFRKMYRLAIQRLEEAKKYYHIKARTENILDIDTLDDTNLPGLMDNDDSRQILHITYGMILKETDSNGGSVLKNEIYKTLYEHEDSYIDYLIRHIGNHFKALGAL